MTGTMAKTPGMYPHVEKLNTAADPRKMRRIIAEDPEWSLAVVPLLSNLCLQHIVKCFEGILFYDPFIIYDVSDSVNG